jgi:hypothetical protein
MEENVIGNDFVYMDEEEFWEQIPDSVKDDFVERRLYEMLSISPIEVKRLMCRVFGLSYYCGDYALRNAMERIVSAK